MQTKACGISAISVSPASNVLTQALICNSRSDVETLAMERSALEFIMVQVYCRSAARTRPFRT